MKFLVTSIFIAAFAAASLHAGTVFKLGSLAPEGTPWDKGLREMAAAWREKSDGAVTVKIYPGGIAGDENGMLRKCRLGQLDIVAVTGVGLSQIVPDIMACEIPLVVTSDAAFNVLFDSLKEEYAARLADKGYMVLMWTKVGWTRFFARAPVVTPDDLRKQKLFVWGGDPTGIQVYKNAGFRPVPLSSNELLTALQSGMVDAFQATPLAAASYQWFGIAKYMCVMEWSPIIGAVVVSKNKWEALPAELGAALALTHAAIGGSLDTAVRAADSSAVAVMEKYGLKKTTVPPLVRAEWKKLADHGIQLLVGREIPRAAYDRVKALAAMIEAASR